jgi:hypothetical protein
MGLKTCCELYARQLQDSDLGALADWLLASCSDGRLEPHRPHFARDSSGREYPDLAPAEVAEVVRYTKSAHWLKMPNGAVIPLADRMAEGESLLNYLGDTLVVPREMALAFAEFPRLVPPAWWTIPKPKKERRPSLCYDDQDEPFLDKMREMIAASPGGRMTAAEAAREVAKTNQLAGEDKTNSAEKRLAGKYQARLSTQPGRSG